MADEETSEPTEAAPAEVAETTQPEPSAAQQAAEVQAEVQAADAAPAPDDSARAAFLDALRARLATSNYGLSAALEVSFTPDGGGLLFAADDAQEALRAASAALAGADDGDGRVWRYAGAGPDPETGRYRAVVRVTPLP
jgi:hypothetical protein